jgi:hypothetical protein
MGAAAAETPARVSTTDAASTAERPATMFPKETWTLEFSTSYFHAIIDDEDIYNAVVGSSYYFDNKHAVRVELLGYKMYQENGGSPDADDSNAFGANLGLRYHFLEYERLSLFIDGIAGMFYGSRNFPKGGTHFNFNEQLGLGATFRLDDNAHLFGGCRFIHISNARIRGADENPGFDGLGGFFGVMFTY